MLYYESQSNDPRYNLALEEYLFQSDVSNDGLFMLWQNNKSVIIGRNQNTAEEVDESYIKSENIPVVRRISGGGAVYHDCGNINFTFITRESNGVFDFKVFLYPLINVLKRMGINAMFNGRNDVTIGERKISGNSQHVRKGKLMHHGCILLDADLEAARRALTVDPEKYISKSVKSVRSRITNINDETDNPVSARRFMDMLKEEVGRSTRLEPLVLTKENMESIKKLCKDKYETWQWNYGSSPRFNSIVKKRYPFGTVSAQIMVEGGIISSVRFYGDFFSQEDVAGLEKILKGTKVNEIGAALNGCSAGKYINGMTNSELENLISGAAIQEGRD